MPRSRAPRPFQPGSLSLDPGSRLPLYRQLYGALRGAMLAGRLPAGTKLPSSRMLAGQLRLSRNTVTAALEQLQTEGFLDTTPRGGTRVAAGLRPSPGAGRPAATRPPALERRAAPSARGLLLAGTGLAPAEPGAGSPRAFRPGAPAVDAFPRSLWTRLTLRRWRGSDLALGYGDPAGILPLREAIATHVTVSREARCTADQVIVVGGSQQAFDLAARILLDPGDAAWLEDPGYLGARAALIGAGARVVPVPLDGEGLDVAEGERRAPEARLACTAPSHQYPTGRTMSAGRRLQLLRWARLAGAWILEDDYDSEFRFASRPIPCLQGMDSDERVIYVGTFSKTLFPAIRLGYLVVPLHVADTFRAARAVADRHSPTVEQAVLADFIGEGHFGRHLRRMRALYEERQAALLELGRPALAEYLELEPSEAGLHLVGWLPRGVDGQRAVAALRAAGVDAQALSRYAIEPCERDALLLGYAAYDRRAIKRGVAEMRKALAAAWPSLSPP